MGKGPFNVQGRCQADAQVLQRHGQSRAVGLAQTDLNIADVKVRQPATRPTSGARRLGCNGPLWTMPTA